MPDSNSPKTPPATPANPLLNLSAEQIKAALSALTPEKLQAIRLVAAQAGLTEGNNKFRQTAKGEIEIQVTIPVDLAVGLMSMVDLANEPAYEYIHGIILDGINGWFSGRGPEEEVPVVEATTKIPTGTTA